MRLRSGALTSIIISIIAVGLLSIGLGQQVITTTSTTVITFPPTTITTVITHPGKVETTTITLPPYKLVMVERRPDQKCVIVLEARPISVFTIPGTTFPGTTYVQVVPARTYETTLTTVIGGTTATRTGMITFRFATTIVMPITTTAFTIPIPIYGKMLEYCKRITVTYIDRFELKRPMTITVSLPGFTMHEMVITVPTMLLTRKTVVTETTTKPGTTATHVYKGSGQKIVKTITFPEKFVTKTIVKQGEIVTKTVTYVTTISSQSPTPSPTTASTTSAEKTSTSTTGIAVTTTPPLLIVGMISAVIIIIVGIILGVLLARRPR